MTRCAGAWRLVAALLFLSGVAASTVQAAELLPVLARVGPWPVISRLIGYGERLWFANSVKGVNHNSADLHSYDPKSDSVRYERHLFSQDAGEPLAAHGLLYWPFEDARFSVGVGHFMVTDGADWRLGTIPTARIFHTHAMAAIDDLLVAATSAWRAGLQVSNDRGATWRQAYDHPTPDGEVTRIVKLAALEDRVFGYLIGRGRQRLLLFDRRRVTQAPDWPRDRPVLGLARLGDQVYGAVRMSKGISPWRTDGARSEEVTPPRADWPVRALASAPDGLRAVTGDDRGGTVWHSANGADWRPTHQFTGGQPFDIAVHRGNVYVGGAGNDGRGILWGTRAAPDPVREPQGALPELDHTSLSATRAWSTAGERLDALLADPSSYAPPDGALRRLVLELALADPPADFFAGRLLLPMPDEPIALIGGNVRVPMSTFGRWLLLWGMAVAGSGRVPPELLEEPWTALTNPAEKYFDLPPAAMAAAALTGQNDAATIAALIGRLAQARDPLWLRGDAVGALSALTGKRFGYGAEAWRAWWDEAKARWPD